MRILLVRLRLIGDVVFTTPAVRAVRERRDSAQADAALRELSEAAAGTENLLPRILACVESEVTVGEISHALRKVWGEYKEAVTV